MYIDKDFNLSFEPPQTSSLDLKPGDLVYIEKVEYGIDPKHIREPQVIESVLRIPVDDDPRGYILQIDIVGLPFMYLEEDVKLYKRK